MNNDFDLCDISAWAQAASTPVAAKWIAEAAAADRQTRSALKPFPRLDTRDIVFVASEAAAREACDVISTRGLCGFDTESRPRFRQGQPDDGPHVLQLATNDVAWVVSIAGGIIPRCIRSLLSSDTVVKVGIGLGNDARQLEGSTKTLLRRHVDVNAVFRALGLKDDVGARRAVAAVFNMWLNKSSNACKSRWDASTLSPAQVEYAGNDAWVPLLLLERMRQALL